MCSIASTIAFTDDLIVYSTTERKHHGVSTRQWSHFRKIYILASPDREKQKRWGISKRFI